MQLQPEQPQAGDDIRTNIVNAALRLFGQKGYHATSLQEIIDEAGCSKGGFYHHFTSKEDLLLMFHDTFIDHLVEFAEAEFRQPAPPLQRLQHICTHLLESMSTFRDHMSVFQNEARYLSPEKAAMVVEKRDRYERLFRNLVEEAIRTGDLREDLDPKIFALALLGAFNWSLRWFKPGRPMGPEAMSAQLFAMLIEGGKRR